MNNSGIADLLAEIKDELDTLDSLASDIKETMSLVPARGGTRRIYEESLALKLHNFYTGCERIFRRIADDINGGVPASPDWHRRLLHTMTLHPAGIRPPVIAKATEKLLADFLGFRHVVRNIYGFQIESEKLIALLHKFTNAYNAFRSDMAQFLRFLNKLRH
jgi:hypothetical protein